MPEKDRWHQGTFGKEDSVFAPMSPPHLSRQKSERFELRRESSAKEIQKALSKISLESKFKLNIMAAAT